MIILRDKKEVETEKKKIVRFKQWCLEHKKEIIITGISIGGIIAGVILNNSSESNKFAKWINSASVDELKSARNLIQADYRNPQLDNEYRAQLYDVLHFFDCKIREKDCVGGIINFPARSEHGWYLQGD